MAQQGGPTTTSPPVADTWNRATALVAVGTADGGRVSLYFTANAAPGTCFLIDDAWLYRQK